MSSSSEQGVTWLPISRFGISPPWLLIACKPRSVIQVDAGLLDRLETDDCNFVFVVDELEVTLPVADGQAAAIECVRQLSPFTRSSSAAGVEVLDDAKLRMQGHLDGEDLRTGGRRGVIVGDNAVTVCDDNVVIGSSRFEISRLKKLGRKGQHLELADGAQLQASLALLVVAAIEFRTISEEVTRLWLRIAQLETRLRGD